MKPLTEHLRNHLRRCTATGLISIVFITFGCGTMNMRYRTAHGLATLPNQFLTINFYSGGDAPLITVLEIAPRKIRLYKVGGRIQDCTLAPKDLAELRGLLSQANLGAIDSDLRLGSDRPEVWVRHQQREVGVLPEDPPSNLVPLLTFVEQLFKKSFPARFDIEIVSRHGSMAAVDIPHSPERSGAKRSCS